jgi:hypothetical protein
MGSGSEIPRRMPRVKKESRRQQLSWRRLFSASGFRTRNRGYGGYLRLTTIGGVSDLSVTAQSTQQCQKIIRLLAFFEGRFLRSSRLFASPAKNLGLATSHRFGMFRHHSSAMTSRTTNARAMMIGMMIIIRRRPGHGHIA